jgi:hypothetical protein
MFHACQATKKCQNFDSHRLQCQVCEERVRPSTTVRGYLAEGEYMPDIQHALAILTRKIKKAMADPNRPGQKISGYDISKKYDQTRKATEMLSRFSNIIGMKLTEEVERVRISEEERQYLGRIL